MNKGNMLKALSAVILVLCALGPARTSVQAAGSRYFPEADKTVNDPFLSYWTGHGGLAQQGFPITDAYNEVNDADGKTYLTQYFERARFEYHPEQSDPKFQVLLGLLGKEALASKYGDNPPSSPAESVPGDGSKTFPETGKTVTGLFLDYWNTHGGLEQQGYPITDAYNEVNDADGQTYITQYFERARFEYHPENGDPKFQVLLGLVGREIYGLKAGNGTGGDPGGGGTVHPGPTTVQNTLSIPGWTHMAVTTNNVAFFYNSDNGHAASARLNPDGSLTVLQKFPDEATGNAAFDPGWDIITPGPYNYLFFYRRDSGAATDCLMGDNGIIEQCANFGFDTDWTSITIDRLTGVIYIYSGSDGHRCIERLNSDGSISTFSCDSNDIKSARKVIPIGYSMWLYYDFATRETGTFSINKDTGEPKLLQTVPDLGLPWGLIASNQSTIGFYSPSGQSSLIASTALDGSIVKLKTYYAPPTISIIATALNGPYLNYSISTGELSVVQVAPDGSATNLQQYKP